VLDDVSFSLSVGESVALLGANASGKSTLLHLLDGLYFAGDGCIKAFGTVLTEESVDAQPFAMEFRRDVGYVFQNSDAQLFCARVDEELMFGSLQLGLSEGDAQAAADEAMDIFGIRHLRERTPYSLSGGEKKKVAFASVYTCNPKAMLLDEPTAGLDPRSIDELTDALKGLQSRGVAYLIATHDLDFVAEAVERAIVLSEQGRVVFDGKIDEILKNEKLLQQVNLLRRARPLSFAPR